MIMHSSLGPLAPRVSYAQTQCIAGERTPPSLQLQYQAMIGLSHTAI